MNNQLKEAGIYSLFELADEPLAFFGFNFSRKESFLEYLNKDELKAAMPGSNVKLLENSDMDLSQLVGQYDRGWELWKWCLVLALVFLAIEILLLRLWKT